MGNDDVRVDFDKDSKIGDWFCGTCFGPIVARYMIFTVPE